MENAFALSAYFSPEGNSLQFNSSIVCEMFSWKDKKKTGLITGAVNMFFMLIVCFDYSVIALAFLFLFFVSLLGMGLNIVYRATNDQQV